MIQAPVGRNGVFFFSFFFFFFFFFFLGGGGLGYDSSTCGQKRWFHRHILGGGCQDLSGFLPPQATLITVVSGKRALGCIVCTTV